MGDSDYRLFAATTASIEPSQMFGANERTPHSSRRSFWFWLEPPLSPRLESRCCRTLRSNGVSTLVLQAHPLDESYSASLLDAVQDALVASGVDSVVVRLAHGEEPDLSAAVFEHLIAVCPTWWGGPPAVLLDWLQRTLSPYVDGSGPATSSPLRSILKLSVVTTHGSSRLMNRMQGEPGRQTWARVVLPCCHAEAEFEWISLYKIDRNTSAERVTFLAEVTQRFTSALVPA